jgi:hypothetical protein
MPVLIVCALVAGLSLSACHKKGKTDSGGGNGPAPAPPTAQTYNVYNDAGGVLGDPNVLLFTGGGLTISEQVGGAPEGSKYLRASNCVPGAFWGVTLDKNATGRVEDLSAFSTGFLTFQIRVNRTVGITERLIVNITDKTPKTQSVLLASGVGFDPSKVDQWQAIRIPISAYDQIDKSKIVVPFAIAVDSPASTPALTIDIDNVQWSAS